MTKLLDKQHFFRNEHIVRLPKLSMCSRNLLKIVLITNKENDDKPQPCRHIKQRLFLGHQDLISLLTLTKTVGKRQRAELKAAKIQHATLKTASATSYVLTTAVDFLFCHVCAQKVFDYSRYPTVSQVLSHNRPRAFLIVRPVYVMAITFSI